MTSVFGWNLRVYWEDTDAGGIVFYANYLKFMERGRSEWLRALGIDQLTYLQQTGEHFVVTELALNYLASAQLDDELLATTQLLEKGRSRLKIKQQIWLKRPQNVREQLLKKEHFLDSTKANTLVQDDAILAKSHKYVIPKGCTKLLCEGTIGLAWVRKANGKAVRLPKDILEVLL